MCAIMRACAVRCTVCGACCATVCCTAYMALLHAALGMPSGVAAARAVTEPAMHCGPLDVPCMTTSSLRRIACGEFWFRSSLAVVELSPVVLFSATHWRFEFSACGPSDTVL